MRSYYLARQMLHRDWRSGELATLAFALVVAVAAVAAITLLTERLTQGMGKESAELIGGDLVIRSTREPDPEWLALGGQLGFRTATTYTFDSVLFHGDEMLMAGVKAVSDDYPLLGNLQTRQDRTAPLQIEEGIPSPGNAWVDARILDRLNAELGDTVEFGATRLRLEKILAFEPDQGNSLFQLAPRVLINAADLEPARVLGPGSRIRYRYLYQGEAVDELRDSLEPRLGVGHTLIAPTDDDNSASDALLKATQYLRIASLLAIVLAAIAIALSARRYSERHYDVSAMLRCLGARQPEIVRLYVIQLTLLTGTCAAIGALFGWLAHLGLLAVLKPLLPIALPPAGPEPWLVTIGSAFLLMAGFALPPVLRMADTPPLRVLRRDLTPIPLSVWLIYGIAGVTQLSLLQLLFDDLPDILPVLLLAALAIFTLGCLIYVGLGRLRRRTHASGGLWQRSIRNLAANAGTSATQVMAFSLTLMLLLTITQLRHGLLDEWRLQLPAQAPNHFAFNIMPDALPRLQGALEESPARMEPFYPVILGRLMAVNDLPPEPEDGDEENAADRELNLTWTRDLPADNHILEGQWPPEGDSVSIEAGYAERLGVAVGDQLRFNSGGYTFDVTVSSIRSVVWESFSPNFFLIFSEQVLGDLPTSYLTSFYLPPESKALVTRWLTQFPGMTVLEVDALIERLELVLSQVSLTVELMLVFVMLTGFAVLFAALQTTADERLHEGALMRSLGASRAYLRRAYLAEFGLLGLAAGILAMVGSDVASAVLYQQVFDLEYAPSPWLWLSIPFLAMAAIAIAGYRGSLKVLKVSPARLLNQ
ncbi:MAG: ABC transporter permease [Porticoccaceae bacterium]|nr:ABC transporter permease [Porticoccaceae bacterium]